MMEPRSNSSWEPFPISRKDMLGNLTGYWRDMRPYREERLSVCRTACPAGEDIPAYIALAAAGNYEEAFLQIMEENPLPAICGRVCFHPCVGNCERTKLDAPVSIHRVERFLGDYGLKHLTLSLPDRSAKGSVAIVGSGPAGLSAAYHARRLGHQVTLFEAESALGGLLRYGIPPYRLPRKVLDESLKMILRMGVGVLTGFGLGSKDSWNDLDKFDAVFLAVGAHESIMPRISNKNESRVVGGLEFLKEINSGLRKSVKKRVAVVGGGNTAIDAARICRRLGAEVTILYRRSRKEMPAHSEEILSALGEGVDLKEQCLPVRIESGSRGRMKVVCLKTEPKGNDASGRTLYEPAKGSELVMDVGMLIMAAGQAVSVPKYTGPVQFSPEGIRVGRDLRCGEGKYFAGGDAVPGLRRVCDAIGSGKLGALSIHCYLEGLNMDEIWTGIRLGQGPIFSMNEFMVNGKKPNPRLLKAVDSSEINLDHFREIPQPEPPQIPPEKAVKSFEEVVGDVDEEELSKTVGRCFSCGTCTVCDICYMYCPDLSVRKIRQGYEFNYDYCKGCAICAEECPRGVIHMEREET